MDPRINKVRNVKDELSFVKTSVLLLIVYRFFLIVPVMNHPVSLFPPLTFTKRSKHENVACENYKAYHLHVIRQFGMHTIVKSIITEPQDFRTVRLTG